MKSTLLVCGFVAASLLGGCGASPAITLPANSQPYACNYDRVELFFGFSKLDGGVVSEAQFKGFLNDVVTPAFPDGLTVIPTTGQWRGGDGKLVREEGRLIIVLLPLGAENGAKIQKVREAYKKQFKQDSVLLSSHPVKADF